jgi:NADH:ubiquinone oxidoreductase subunit 6 (subunit J)
MIDPTSFCLGAVVVLIVFVVAMAQVDSDAVIPCNTGDKWLEK